MLTSLMIKMKGFACFMFQPTVALFSLLGSFGLGLIEKYFFSDWELLGWVTWIMVVQTLSEVYKDFKKRQLSRRSLDETLHKCIIYGFILILYHILKNYYMPARYLIVEIVLREAIAIIENLSQVTDFIPKWFLDRLKEMHEKGDLKGFEKGKENAKD